MTDTETRTIADRESLDALFHEAVAAIDAGDASALERLVAEHPELLSARLEEAGPWLRDVVGDALDGFFGRPYLLWFVAEDPVRAGRLPANIASIARLLIEAARRAGVASLPEQVDYALSLVSWSWIASECGVQLELIDVLVDAGASLAGNPENALVNGHFEAAEHLLAHGARPSLASALCLGRWNDVERLASAATPIETRFAFVLAALNGRAEALRRMVERGCDVNARSEHLYSHGTPLHHAVSSGSLESVRVLVDAGAGLDAVDTAWGGTPLGWAEHYRNEHRGDARRRAGYDEIAALLRDAGAT